MIKKMNKKIVKKYFLTIFLKIFLRFLAESDFFYYSLNGYPKLPKVEKM